MTFPKKSKPVQRNAVRSLIYDIPAWTPSGERESAFANGLLRPMVRHVEESRKKTQDIIARLRATWLRRFYINHLKQYSCIRWLVSWLWRNLYPIYLNFLAGVAIHLRDRQAMRWRRLIQLSKLTAAQNMFKVRLADPELVQTLTPKAYPEEDRICLRPPYESYIFPELFVLGINNGRVYGGTNLILFKNQVICHDLYDFKRDYTSEELHGRTLIDPKSNRIRWLLHDEAPEPIPVAAAFVDACAFNYAHWMTEVLPRIALFCNEPQFNRIPIVVDEGLHENIMESLFLVTGPEREIITLPIGRALFVDTLYLTSVAGYVPFERRSNKLSGHSHGKFSPQAFELLRNRMEKFRGKHRGEFPEKIFLHRNSGYRKVVNVNEIEKVLVDRGYVIVEPEKLTFLEQFQIFRNASEVISPTGAALSNAIFCKSGTRLGVLMAKHKNMIYRYWLNMLTPLQIEVSYVLGEIVSKYDIGIHADSYVNPQNIFELLEMWQKQ